jgi:hypothetical protein
MFRVGIVCCAALLAAFEPAMAQSPVERGSYLVTIGHCMECHSAWSRGVSDFGNGLGLCRPERSRSG